MLYLLPKMRAKRIIQVVTSFVLGAILLYLLKTFVIYVGFPDIEILLLRVLTYGAILEELLKFLVSYLIIRMFGFSPITASFVGLGFGFSEQLIHIAYGDKALIHTMLMHYASGLASSFYFYKAKTFEYKKYVWQALIAPISVHGLFNIGIWIWLMTYIYLL
jgi:hypothetical protein